MKEKWRKDEPSSACLLNRIKLEISDTFGKTYIQFGTLF